MMVLASCCGRITLQVVPAPAPPPAPVPPAGAAAAAAVDVDETAKCLDEPESPGIGGGRIPDLRGGGSSAGGA